MPEGDDDGGQKPEYFCENIRSGFKTCGSSDVVVYPERRKIKKIIKLPKCTRSGGSRYIIMEFNSYINNLYRNIPYPFKGFNNPK